LEEYKDDEEREREEKKHHLYQLRQQLEQYLQELPVVGFNTVADVEFIQRGHPLVREEPFLFCTLVGFQVLTITKAGRKIIFSLPGAKVWNDI
jgi:hypothetical protein